MKAQKACATSTPLDQPKDHVSLWKLDSDALQVAASEKLKVLSSSTFPKFYTREGREKRENTFCV